MLLDLRDGEPLGRVHHEDGAQQLLHLARSRAMRGEPVVRAHDALQQLRARRPSPSVSTELLLFIDSIRIAHAVCTLSRGLIARGSSSPRA